MPVREGLSFNGFKRIHFGGMRIPILPVSNQLGELAILELQGEIIPKKQTFEFQTIGPLTVHENGHATLVIGNHELHGKVHKLKKPLLVLERGSVDAVKAVACIRQKVVFSERPLLIFPAES